MDDKSPLKGAWSGLHDPFFDVQFVEKRCAVFRPTLYKAKVTVTY